MKLKAYIGIGLSAVLLATSIGAYAAASGAAEPEQALKPALFSALYEGYLPTEWFKTAKIGGELTRKDAAYLAVNTYAKASGRAAEWIDYKTDLADSEDPMLSRAVDLGLLSVGADLKFNGSKTVSEQELAVLTTKLLTKFNGYQKPVKALTYSDQAKIAAWAKPSVQFLSERQWLPWVKNGKYEPAKATTLGRAIYLSDQVLTHLKVTPAAKAAATGAAAAKRYDVKGFKVPLPTDTALQISVLTGGQLQISFSGVIADRSLGDNKAVLAQLAEILDSNDKVSYEAQSALLALIHKAWDATDQSYGFEKTVYVRLDNGAVSAAKPAAAALELAAGSAVVIRITQ